MTKQVVTTDACFETITAYEVLWSLHREKKSWKYVPGYENHQKKFFWKLKQE